MKNDSLIALPVSEELGKNEGSNVSVNSSVNNKSNSFFYTVLFVFKVLIFAVAIFQCLDLLFIILFSSK